MDILEYIPYGRENAIKRKTLRDLTGLSDRDMRRAIELARQETPIINLQDGRGYYRPDDRDDLQRYVLQEQARAKKILQNINVACRAYNDIVGQTHLEGL